MDHGEKIEAKFIYKDRETARKLHEFNRYSLERAKLEVEYENYDEAKKWAVEFLKGAADLDELKKKAGDAEIIFKNLQKQLAAYRQRNAYRGYK